MNLYRFFSKCDSLYGLYIVGIWSALGTVAWIEWDLEIGYTNISGDGRASIYVCV